LDWEGGEEVPGNSSTI
jgi:hypothetical protein